MSQRPYEVLPGHHGGRIKVSVAGSELLRIPRLNRGTAFTLEERERFGLIGHLPTGVTPLEAQLHRSYNQFLRAETDLDKFAFLSALRDRNTVLFYRLLSEHLEEMMPIVYTPTIGAAIVEFSQSYQRLHGVFLSIDNPEQIERSLQGQGRNPEDVDLLIVTDSEGILGIGDQGVGGIQIALGKKSPLHGGCGHRPEPGHRDRPGRGHRQPGPVVRPALPGPSAQPGPRPALRRLHRGVRHCGDRGVPLRDDPLGGLRRRQRPPGAHHVPGSDLHLQRRRAGHRGCGRGGRPGRGPLQWRSPARPAHRHPRCRDRRGRRRGPDARHDDQRGRDARAGHGGASGGSAAAGCSRPRSGTGSGRSSGRTHGPRPRPMRGRWTPTGTSAWPTWSATSGPPSSSAPPANPGPSPSTSSARWPRTWTSP